MPNPTFVTVRDVNGQTALVPVIQPEGKTAAATDPSGGVTVPAPSGTGTWKLQSILGVLTWVTDT